ncbi:MAG: bifunctional metallophosphatase/5'-nucleotidase [Bergeyella sp.]|nr:bifunctional metallophosphatase/5'-nucleotidase [Bergeyella sp.]
MDRRHFLQTSLGGLGCALFPQFLLTQEKRVVRKEKKLTLLHTNDQHSRIEPFEKSYIRNPNQGGFARRAKLISEIRKTEPNVLLLDSGDIFQGTPYFNLFGGALELKLMSLMHYDASTLGNHEYDNGLEGFLKVLPEAKFPFITSNYDFRNTVLEGKTRPYKTFRRDGIKIGVFGLGIELDGLVSKSNYKETVYEDPISVAQHFGSFLKKEKKCDLVICLSHLGYDYKMDKKKVSDLHLARQTENIDFILGGHTHTFLPEPQKHKNRKGKQVIINQVGWAGLLLGRIDIFFDSEKKIKYIAWDTKKIDNKIIA